MTTTAVVKPFRVVHPDGRIEHNFNVPQTLVMDSEWDITVMQAGTGSGKTSALVTWLRKEMNRCGPGDYLCAGPTFPLLEPRVIPELKEMFVYTGWGEFHPGAHPPRFVSHEKGANGEPLYILWLGSAANPESLESATYKAAGIDELAQKQFTRQSWEAIQRRVGFFQGRVLGTTTLYEVSNWYKTDVYDKWKQNDPHIYIIQADSTANPAYPTERYEYARSTMPPWKFNMFYRGVFERPTGLIYDVFDEETQVIPRFDLRLPQYRTWLHMTGHDFGPNNTASISVAQDPGTGWLYLHEDYHRGGLSVGQHVEEFKRLNQGLDIRKRVGGAWGEEEARYAYTAAGWPIQKPNIRDVEAGIDRAYSFVAKNQLFVFSDCHRFLNEMLTYSRKLDENYETTDVIQAKSRFHLMDCWRYLASSLAPERSAGRKGASIQVFRNRAETGHRRRRRPVRTA